MFTENELTPPLEQSKSTTPANPAARDAAFAAIGMEFDPHHFHGEPVDGEANPADSASGCPYARFFSGLFGSGNG
jgi:hypothetical protein